ncbi:MAG: hypothetical protein Q4C72_05710 [Eubacteriales bacterium]|nr:hypothetical protein [Eubacteriales bacterium]
MSPISKAQQKATAKYVKENYDRIEIKVSKGKKALYRDHAAAQGESLSAFLSRAADEAMRRDREDKP